MPKKRVVILQASANSYGHTANLVDYICSKSNFDSIDLKTKKIGYFDYGFKNKNDDFLPLMKTIVAEYDIIVFATPVYWYSMSAILKCFFDRISDCLKTEKELGRKLRGKEIAVLSCGYDTEINDGFYMPFRESSKYLGMKYLGNVYCHPENTKEPEDWKMKLDEFSKRIIYPDQPKEPNYNPKELARQLRKPTGEYGLKVSDMMNHGNGVMNMHTLTVVQAKSEEKILEIGMGNGHFVANIIQAGKNIYYTGVDFSKEMVEYAAEKNKELVDLGKVEFQLGNVENLPLESEMYDTVFTVNTMYFWKDCSKAFGEIKRVLKAEGHLVIAVRPKHILETIEATAYGFSKRTNSEIARLMIENGFTPPQITEIKEPLNGNWGENQPRETVIFRSRKA